MPCRTYARTVHNSIRVSVVWYVFTPFSKASQRALKGFKRGLLGGQFMTEKSRECSSNQAVANHDLWEEDLCCWNTPFPCGWPGRHKLLEGWPRFFYTDQFYTRTIYTDLHWERLVQIPKIPKTAKRKHLRPSLSRDALYSFNLACRNPWLHKPGTTFSLPYSQASYYPSAWNSHNRDSSLHATRSQSFRIHSRCSLA